MIILFSQYVKHNIYPDFMTFTNMKGYVPSVNSTCLTIFLKLQRMANLWRLNVHYLQTESKHYVFSSMKSEAIHYNLN